MELLKCCGLLDQSVPKLLITPRLFMGRERAPGKHGSFLKLQWCEGKEPWGRRFVQAIEHRDELRGQFLLEFSAALGAPESFGSDATGRRPTGGARGPNAFPGGKPIGQGHDFDRGVKRAFGMFGITVVPTHRGQFSLPRFGDVALNKGVAYGGMILAALGDDFSCPLPEFADVVEESGQGDEPNLSPL